MHQTRLQDRKRFVAQMMTKEHWRLLEVCWKHNLKRIYSLYEKTDRDSPPALKVVLRIGIEALETVIELFRAKKLNEAKPARSLEKHKTQSLSK